MAKSGTESGLVRAPVAEGFVPQTRDWKLYGLFYDVLRKG